jgi:hypothetical protein
LRRLSGICGCFVCRRCACIANSIFLFVIAWSGINTNEYLYQTISMLNPYRPVPILKASRAKCGTP